jgi:hypothetical protein
MGSLLMVIAKKPKFFIMMTHTIVVKLIICNIMAQEFIKVNKAQKKDYSDKVN